MDAGTVQVGVWLIASDTGTGSRNLTRYPSIRSAVYMLENYVQQRTRLKFEHPLSTTTKLYPPNLGQKCSSGCHLRVPSAFGSLDV